MTLQEFNKHILIEHKKKVATRTDWHSLLVLEYCKQNNIKLNEGLFDTIKQGLASGWETGKYQFGKLGSLEKGGKFFGRGKATKELGAEREAAVEKLAQSTITKNLVGVLRKAHPEFPNMKTQQEFVQALEKISVVYDSIAAATKSGKLKADEANSLIGALRSLVKVTLDRDLADVYKHFNESLLNEAEPVDYAKETGTMKGLTSTTLPKVLAALGALGVGFGWLVKQAWFLSMFRNPTTLMRITRVLVSGSNKGVTEHLAVLLGTPGANISGMTVADFIAKMKVHGLADAAGNPTANLLNLARDAGNTNFASWWARNLAGPSHAAQTLEQAIPLSGAGAAGAGGDIFTGRVSSTVVTAMGGGLTTTGATLAGLGPLMSTLGIGLITSGALIYWVRQNGLKSSRASLLAGLMNKMQDVQGAQQGDTTEQPGQQQSGEKQVVHVYKRGGEENDSLTRVLMGLGLPNWAVKDLTTRVKKELEANNFVVKENKNLYDLLMEDAKKRRTYVRRIEAANSIDKLSQIEDELSKEDLSTRKNKGILNAIKAKKYELKDSKSEEKPQETKSEETQQSGPPSSAPSNVNNKLLNAIMEFGSDTTVEIKMNKDGKAFKKQMKFTRKQIFDQPQQFLNALSSEEKMLLLRLPDNPNVEPSKVDFFTMTTDERKEMYQKIKKGLIDFGAGEEVDTGRDKSKSMKGQKEKGQGREFMLPSKATDTTAGEFKISDLRNILRTGHTTHKAKPIPDQQIRSAQKAITAFLSPYLKKAGVALRESQIESVVLGFIAEINNRAASAALVSESQINRWKKLANII